MANRLAEETSPYLLQHAENPVDWYPWGEEAFARARAGDLPVLLSIGYSACHWCHVMERESFEDPETARIMNDAFVSIKVDREERPDVDSVYMRAVQSMTGQGGWPLTAFLTPDGAPFYGGTYFPPEPRHGMPSFQQVLAAAADAYRTKRGEVEAAADQLRSLLQRSMADAGAEGPPGDDEDVPNEELLDEAYGFIRARFDPDHGGFGSAPKFPQPVTLEFVLRHHVRTGNQEALDIVVETLRGMAHGGIHDHLGGGFHRYSVDARWLVPHFEKMLYDNALLARSYLAAHQVTGDPELRQVAERTLDYVLADLRSPEGGFYCARDADSEGEEGLFYVWTPDQLAQLLAPERARLVGRVYDVSGGGNFEGRSILWLPHDVAVVAKAEDMEVDALVEIMDAARPVLLAAREEREPPFRDEKVISSWNGLTIRALSEAGGALGRSDYVEAARTAAVFVLERLRPDGRLLRSYKDGDARVTGFLEDYGAVGNALLTLHEVTLEPDWLVEAVWMADRALELFWEPGASLFYDTPSDGESLLVRPRDVMDNAIPSGNSLAIELLLRLAEVLAEARYRRVAEAALARDLGAMKRYPLAFGRLLSVTGFALSAPVEIAVVGPAGDEATEALLGAALEPYLPNRVVTGRDPHSSLPFETPLLEGRDLVDGKPAVYVCRRYACHAPVTTPDAVRQALATERGPRQS